MAFVPPIDRELGAGLHGACPLAVSTHIAPLFKRESATKTSQKVDSTLLKAWKYNVLDFVWQNEAVQSAWEVRALLMPAGSSRGCRWGLPGGSRPDMELKGAVGLLSSRTC